MEELDLDRRLGELKQSATEAFGDWHFTPRMRQRVLEEIGRRGFRRRLADRLAGIPTMALAVPAAALAAYFLLVPALFHLPGTGPLLAVLPIHLSLDSKVRATSLQPGGDEIVGPYATAIMLDDRGGNGAPLVLVPRNGGPAEGWGMQSGSPVRERILPFSGPPAGQPVAVLSGGQDRTVADRPRLVWAGPEISSGEPAPHLRHRLEGALANLQNDLQRLRTTNNQEAMIATIGEISVVKRDLLRLTAGNKPVPNASAAWRLFSRKVDSAAESWLGTIDGEIDTLVAGDLTGDGLDELLIFGRHPVTAGDGRPFLQVWTPRGADLHHGYIPLYAADLDSRPETEPIITDVDGDGRQEVILSQPDGLSAYGWQGETLTRLWRLGLVRGRAAAWPLGGASLPGLVVWNQEEMWVLLTTSGRPRELWHGFFAGFLPAPLRPERPLAATDLDNDGRADLLLATGKAGRYLYLTLAGRTLRFTQLELAGRLAAVADLDGDGHKELVTLTPTGKVRLDGFSR